MLTITARDYAAACGCRYETALRRLNKLPVAYTSPRQYHVASALPTLMARERPRAPLLLDVAKYDAACLFVDDGMQDVAARLVEWLDEEQKRRLYILETHFTACLAVTMASSEIFTYLPQLHRRLLLHPVGMRYVIGGGECPDLRSFAVPFALANARAENLPHLEKEAANG